MDLVARATKKTLEIQSLHMSVFVNREQSSALTLKLRLECGEDALAFSNNESGYKRCLNKRYVCHMDDVKNQNNYQSNVH